MWRRLRAALEAFFVEWFHATAILIGLGGFALCTTLLFQRSLLLTALLTGLASGVLWYLASALMWEDARANRVAPASTAQAALNAYAAVATGFSAATSACASLVTGDRITVVRSLLG